MEILQETESERWEGDSRLLAQIVSASNDAIVSKTLDGVITGWNPAASQIFGYTAREAIGQNVSILIPHNRMSEEEEIIRRLKAGHKVEHYETLRCHKDGSEILVSLSVSPILDTGGNIVGVSKIVRDVTEKRQSEARIRALEAEVAHVARLSTMSQMSAAISHELNQPLTAILIYVRTAQRLLPPETLALRQMESVRDAMDKAAGQTIRAGSILRRLREFAEKREPKRHLENLNEIVEESVALGFLKATSKLKVTMDLSPVRLLVLVDRIQIQQVLLNLIRNSVEAMADWPMQEITLSTGLEDAAFAWVTIRDTGPGLPPEILVKLFQPFVTTKQSGMGLGLNICQSIVEAHGGRIQALADGTKGAGFQIHLPYCALTAKAVST